ncbi:MAG: hypothetical protein JW982_04985 [Spirochaetes bacterium]|nr:hypothetical protein [Spirochaetota bacterium]
MKSSIILTAAVFLLLSCSGTKVQITRPGKGIVPGKSGGRLLLGMKSEEAKKILGNNPSVKSYQSEYDDYTEFGYTPENEQVFKIGFDYLLEYKPETNISDIPAWKLYFKNNRLVYINFSNFIYPEISQNYRTPTGLFFKTRKEIKDILGNDGIFTNNGNLNYNYPRKGILVIFTENEPDRLRVIHIFDPL